MNTYTIGIVDGCDCSSTSTVDLSKYDKHIQDTTVHITQKERDAWNSASAAISGVNIISALSNKADREDVPTKVSQLQNDMGYLNEVPEEYLTELELKNKGFIRISDLDGLLEGKIPALSGYATTSWVLSQGFLTEHQHIKQISDGTNTYSLIGDGVVTIKGGTSSGTGTSMVTATADRIGGIKLGYQYTQNVKNYPVKLDSEDRAYVYVPWVDGGGSSSTGNNSGYYEIIFKAVEKGVNTDVAPKLPTDFDTNPEGWGHYAVNSDGTKVVWMTQRFVNADGTKDPWQDPWIISGPSGEMGVDGAYYEYIYTRTNSEDATTVPGLTNSQENDFVPPNWTDNPQGVSQSMQYEWMAFRKKTFNENNVGTWSDFIGPILWSKYGVNGNDGDGVEYIYYATSREDDNDPTGSLDPSTWYEDSQSKNNSVDAYNVNPNTREYIRQDKSSYWFDDPVNLTFEGQKQYVSVRKKYADVIGEDPYWHKYSQPALWNAYPKSATATGLMLSYTDPNITVDITTAGIASTPISTTTQLTGTYGTEKVKFTKISVVDIKYTSGEAVPFTLNSSSDSEWKFDFNDGSGVNFLDTLVSSTNDTIIDCKVNAPLAQQLNVASSIVITLSIEGVSDVTNTTVTGAKAFRITGVQFGQDGVSYNLVVDTSIITNRYDTSTGQWYIVPDSGISAKIIKTTLSGGFSTQAIGTSEGFDIKYYVDKHDSEGLTSLSNGLISIEDIQHASDSITVMAYYNGSVFDTKTINVVSDGAPGKGGTSPTYYYINIVYSTLQNKYDDTTKTRQLTGVVQFQVLQQKDGKTSYIAGTDNIVMSPFPKIGYSYNSNDYTITADFDASYTYSARSSVIISYMQGAVPLASVAVPVASEGATGSVQDLKYSTLTYAGDFTSTLNNNTGTNSRVTLFSGAGALSGSTYQQNYMAYKNIYYLCTQDVELQAIAGTTKNIIQYRQYTADGSGTWISLTSMDQCPYLKPMNATESQFIDRLAANSAYIRSLGTNQVTVLNDENTVVAGMTSGSQIPNGINASSNNNGVRIWAGSIESNGDLNTAPFTVDSAGHLKATDAQISGEIDAVSGTIGGWDITQNSIQKIYKDDDSNKSANIYLQNSTNKIVQIGGISNSMMSVRNDGNIGIDISSFGSGGIGLRVLGNANAYGIISFGHTNFISRQGERTYINQLALQNLVLTDDSVTASNVGPKISSPTPIDQQVVPYRIFAIENKNQTIDLGDEFCGDKQIEIILGSRNNGSACTKTISATWLSKITWIGSHLHAVKMSGTTIQFLVGHINDNNIAMYKITIIKSTEYIAIVNRL